MTTAQMMKMAMVEAHRRFPDNCDDDICEEAAMILDDWHADAAQEREIYGVEDTPCIESADRWGTGEGRFHGVV